MVALVSIFGILTLVIPPCLMILVFLDLPNKPTMPKSILKMVLGVIFGVPILMCEKGIMAIFIGTLCILITLFGTADMAACRRDINN